MELPSFVDSIESELAKSGTPEEALLKFTNLISKDMTLYSYYMKLKFDPEQQAFLQPIDRQYAIDLLRIHYTPEKDPKWFSSNLIADFSEPITSSETS